MEFALTPEALPEAQLKSEACLREELLWFGWSDRVRRAAAEMAQRACDMHARTREMIMCKFQRTNISF